MPNETKLCKHCQTEIPKKAKTCPHCRGKQGTGCLVWVLGVFAVLVILGALASGGDDEEKAAKTSKADTKAEEVKQEEPKEEEQEEISYTPYSVSQMMDDLDSNAMNAETTYKNQYVEITGVLSTIDSGGKYISLLPEGEEFAIIGVQCYIKDDAQKSKVAAMTKGDIVTLRGKITSVGEIMGYSLDIDEIL